MKENKPVNNQPMIIRLPIIIAFTLVAGMLIGANFFSGQSRMNNVAKGVAKYREVLSLVENNYVDSVSTDSLVEFSIKKMLEKLDPHTSYFSTEDVAAARSQLESGFDGIGIEFNVFNDTVYVVNAMVGGPSDAVGIKSGDRLIKADGVSLIGQKVNSSLIFSKLRGPRGSEVELEIVRSGESKIRQFTVTRDRIPSYSINAGFMMDNQTGYIKVDRFSESTYDEFHQVLSSLKSQGLKRLVLDLRGNPGGYKDRAEKMVDELLSDERLIVYTKGKGSKFDSQTFTRQEGIFEKGAVIVLVDENSASAAEIVAGALQDNDRALIVGRRSFGKGLVQMPITLHDGSELRLTISRYYTPSGRSIQKPYSLGKEEDYEKDYETRMKSGEFFSSDSIKFNEKLKYKTVAGRTVYGGGGITPDVFVARDTSYYSKYLTELFSKNVIREYALNYANKNLKTLEKLNFKEFNKQFVVTDAMMADLQRLATQAKVKQSAKDYDRSNNYIKGQIKALVARSVWQRKAGKNLNNEYYQVMTSFDETIQKALQNFDKADKLAHGEIVETLTHSGKQ
ncbi:S41 family peptidase [Arcicella aquatica]|uniref:S41 family peptidase n=1 Tax=Arcicella aquatica TaxID=217141 RepID=A0ABU5QRB7_9BACT|nr:S41 family peptidase [Arcicella aquatica]MEA5259642.1 S41 family peptidase [Arcicella aquatica]